jgi:photosystem II stability/assembly factor-like uncharacterized protein
MHGWARVSRAPHYALADLAFRAPCEGVLVGARLGVRGASGIGAIMRTVDGGRRLAAAQLPRAGPLNAVAAVWPRAWAVGARGVILTSSDAGQSWILQRPGRGNTLDGVFFLDARHGWAVGRGSVLRTSNGGRRWVASSIPAGTSLRDVAFADAGHGWAVGAVGTGPGRTAAVILASSDGGRTWRRAWQLADGILLCIDSVNGHVYVGGAAHEGGGAALLVVSRDGGKSWRRLPVVRGVSIGGIAFANIVTGWISVDRGAGGEVLRTDDGGRVWRTQARPTPFAAGPLSFVGDSGWMVGDFGLFATGDGGT